MAVALPLIAVGLAVAGTAVGVVGAISQAQAQRRSYNYNAQVAENNALAARQQAAYEATRTRERYRRILGSQRAGYGASGVDLSGSAIDVMQDTVSSGELDALTNIYQGTIASNRFEAEAQLNRMSASNASRAGMFSAVGTLLSGASSIAGGASGFIPATGAIGSSPANPGVVGVGTSSANIPQFRVNPSLNPAY